MDSPHYADHVRIERDLLVPKVKHLEQFQKKFTPDFCLKSAKFYRFDGPFFWKLEHKE